jgi:hypothetical protein
LLGGAGDGTAVWPAPAEGIIAAPWRPTPPKAPKCKCQRWRKRVNGVVAKGSPGRPGYMMCFRVAGGHRHPRLPWHRRKLHPEDISN